MSDPDAEAIIKQFRAKIEAVDNWGQRFNRFQRAITAVRFQGHSEHHEVTVVVDSGGRLCALEFSDAAMECDPKVLSRLVLTTIEQAHRKAAEQVVQIANEHAGAGSELAERISLAARLQIIPVDCEEDETRQH